MAKKSIAPIILGVGALGGIAAVLVSKKAKAAAPTAPGTLPLGPPSGTMPGLPPGPIRDWTPSRPSPPGSPGYTGPKSGTVTDLGPGPIRDWTPSTPTTTRPNSTPETKPPPAGTRNKTIGLPYMRGRANEKRNAVISCNRNPKSHPNGRTRGSRPQDVWLTDLAYWETNDLGPIRIDTGNKTHAKYQNSWARIFSHVKDCIAKKRAKKVADAAAAKAAAKPQPPKKKSPPPPIPKPSTPPGPKIPDLEAERRNAIIAVRTEPTSSGLAKPYDRQRGSSEKNHMVWLSNWAYWRTYPTAPLKISEPKGKDRVWALAWLRVRDYVRDGLAAKKRGQTPPQPAPAPPPPPAPRPADPRPAPPSLPPPTLKTSKSDIAAATERRNAAIYVVDRPTSYPRLNKSYRPGRGYQLRYWLTNLAYWTTYPEGPTALKPADATHKPYIAAFKRILKNVEGMLVLHKRLDKSNPLVSAPTADRNWQIWALAMWSSSALRTPAVLADTYKKASQYLSATAPGKAVLKRDRGTKAGPLTVTGSGLTAEAAIRVPSGEISQVARWRKAPSRAFWATTTIY